MPGRHGGHDTELCEPADPAFQAWLQSIPGVLGTGERCEDDVTAPECRLVEHVRNSHIRVRLQDAGSGLADVEVLRAENAAVVEEAFSPGTTGPVLVTATKLDPEQPSVVALRITDVAGNQTECDPVVSTLTAEVPGTFRLGENYPNPFNPRTTIRFDVAEQAYVVLAIYDVLGRRVVTLVDQEMQPGRYTAEWAGMNDAGRAVAGGLYLYRLQAGRFIDTRTMMLTK